MRAFRTVLLVVLIATGVKATSIKDAIDLYEQKKYDRSYQAFKSLFRSNMRNFDVNLYLARSAVKVKAYNDAVAAYERALIINDGSVVARFELAALYYEQRVFDQAETEFKTILQKPLPAEIRRMVIEYMAAISQGRKKHNFTIQAAIGLLDDSNVYADSDKSIGSLVNESRSDVAHFEQVAFNHVYNLQARDHFWQTRFIGYNQEYYHQEAARTTFVQLESGWMYKKKSFQIFMPFSVDIVGFGGEEIYKNYSAGVSLDNYIGSVVLTTAIQYSKKINFKDKNANIYDIKLKLNSRDDDGNLLFYNLGVNKEDSENKFKGSTTKASVGAKYFKILPGNWSYELGLNYKYRKDSKKDMTPLIGSNKKRTDNQLEFAGSLNMPADRTSYIKLNFSYADNNSNIDIYSYKKSVFGVSYNIYFGGSDIRKRSLE